MRDGKDEFIRKVKQYQPLIACFNGKGLCQNANTTEQGNNKQQYNNNNNKTHTKTRKCSDFKIT